MSLVFRKAAKEDYHTVMKLYGDFISDQKRYSAFDNDSFLKVIASKDSAIELAELDGRLVGFVSYSKRRVVRYPKPILEIEELYVAPEARRRGIGKQLIQHAIDSGSDCQYVFIASAKQWLDAHKLYSAMGFDPYGFHYRKKSV